MQFIFYQYYVRQFVGKLKVEQKKKYFIFLYVYIYIDKHTNENK